MTNLFIVVCLFHRSAAWFRLWGLGLEVAFCGNSRLELVGLKVSSGCQPAVDSPAIHLASMSLSRGGVAEDQMNRILLVLVFYLF